MAANKSTSILVTIGISALTSIVCAVVVVYFFANRPVHTAGTKPTADPRFAAYGKIINGFLAIIRKGDADTAYNETSPVFQKLTTKNDFQKLVSAYQLAGSIPTEPCAVTQYSDPFPSTISGVSGSYSIVQTKCEITQSGMTRGFTVEFIGDNGTPEISYINVYTNPVIHTKQ